MFTAGRVPQHTFVAASRRHCWAPCAPAQAPVCGAVNIITGAPCVVSRAAPNELRRFVAAPAVSGSCGTAKPFSELLPTSVISLSPAAQACLQEAQHQALSMNSAVVYPGHLLLGCLQLPAMTVKDTDAASDRAPNNEVYPCRRTQQLLLEVGVDVHEAERVVRDGLLELSLISNPASSSPQATKSSSARAVIPGLTQHVVQQACKLAANAGHSQAQPIHLLMSLLYMTPLPTVLHNPFSWVLDKSPLCRTPAQHVMSQLHSELTTRLALSQSACKARLLASNGPTLEAVQSMGLSDIAKFLGSLRAGFAVLQPDVCSAVVKRLQELEVLGRCSPSWNNRYTAVASTEWLQLFEGAEAQGIHVGFVDLQHAIPTLRAVQTPLDLHEPGGSLAFALCRVLHRQGRKWQELNNLSSTPYYADHIIMPDAKERGPLVDILTQRIQAAAIQGDWPGVIQAADTLAAVDSATSAGGSLAVAGLRRLAREGVQGASHVAMLEAASHICSYLGTPGKSWQAALSLPHKYLEHLPASSSVAIFAAGTRGVSLDYELDKVNEEHLPACGPAELVTLAEVGSRVQQPLPVEANQANNGGREWRKVARADGNSWWTAGGQVRHHPYSNVWWASWRDCVCSMPRSFTSEEATRLITALAGLHAHGLLPEGLLQEPAALVIRATATSYSSSNNSSSSNRTQVENAAVSSTEVEFTALESTAATTTTTGTTFTLADAITIMVHMHLGNMEGAGKATLVNATTQLMLAANDSAVSTSLAAILEQDSKHSLGLQQVDKADVPAIVAHAHAQAVNPFVTPAGSL